MSIFPSSPDIGDEYSGYFWDGTVWQAIGIDLAVNYATYSQLTAHEVDTSDVHGIADTSALATQTYVNNAVSSFESFPDQTGESGKFLTTDGSVVSWAVVIPSIIDGGTPSSIESDIIDGGTP
jgi:hypothetical protein